MSEQLVARFIDALGRLERDRDVATIAGLFGEDARIANVIMPDPVVGPAGARSFWSMYRDTFGTIASHFDNVFVCGDKAALEWTARGTGHRGQPIRYRGVSILEMSGDRLSRFTAYFDPADLGAQLGRHIAADEARR